LKLAVSFTSANSASLLIEQVMESQETVSHFYKNITSNINIRFKIDLE